MLQKSFHDTLIVTSLDYLIALYLSKTKRGFFGLFQPHYNVRKIAKAENKFWGVRFPNSWFAKIQYYSLIAKQRNAITGILLFCLKCLNLALEQHLDDPTVKALTSCTGSFELSPGPAKRHIVANGSPPLQHLRKYR